MTFLSDKYTGAATKVPWVTARETFSPTFNMTTNATSTGAMWRIGNMLFMETQTTFSGANTDAGTVLFTLPNSLEMDESILDTTQNNSQVIIGQAIMRDASGQSYHCWPNHNSTTQIRFTFIDHQDVTTSGNYESALSTASSYPITIASGDVFTMRVAVPISGWNVERTLTPRGSTFRGAVVTLSSAQTMTTATATTIDWDTEEYDTDGFWEGVTNPDRLTVPAGVSKVKVSGQVRFATGSTGVRYSYITCSDTNIVGMPRDRRSVINSSVEDVYVGSTPVISVAEGDYFTLGMYHTEGSNLNTGADPYMWFAIEVIE